MSAMKAVDVRVDDRQLRLTNLALHFLRKHRLLNQAARFDVITISWPAGSCKPSITHHRQAFEAAGRFQMFS